MNTKEKGARRERQCKKELEAQDYLCTKAGGSLGAFDIVAISTQKCKEKKLRLVQVKSNYCPKGERITIKTLALPKMVKVQKEIWIYKDRKGVKKEIV